MSIARAHYHRTLAERESKAAGATVAPAAGTLAGRMAAQLAMHQAMLKTLKSRQAKIAAKRDLLPGYAAYIDGVLAADTGGQDAVVTRLMLWRLDIADWDGALAIAAYGLRHGLGMPDGFSRDLPATLLEEIADAALGLAAPDPALAEPLDTALALTAEADMPDEIRAKAHKALGQILARDPAAAERAMAHLEAALTLDPKSGVKTELARLKKAMDAPAASA